MSPRQAATQCNAGVFDNLIPSRKFRRLRARARGKWISDRVHTMMYINFIPFKQWRVYMAINDYKWL